MARIGASFGLIFDSVLSDKNNCHVVMDLNAQIAKSWLKRTAIIYNGCR